MWRVVLQLRRICRCTVAAGGLSGGFCIWGCVFELPVGCCKLEEVSAETAGSTHVVWCTVVEVGSRPRNATPLTQSCSITDTHAQRKQRSSSRSHSVTRWVCDSVLQQCGSFWPPSCMDTCTSLGALCTPHLRPAWKLAPSLRSCCRWHPWRLWQPDNCQYRGAHQAWSSTDRNKQRVAA